MAARTPWACSASTARSASAEASKGSHPYCVTPEHTAEAREIMAALLALEPDHPIARQTGLATQMFCAAGLESTADLCEWIWNGAIGPVREVHNWSSRPFWPQGMTAAPPEAPVPDGLDWDGPHERPTGWAEAWGYVDVAMLDDRIIGVGELRGVATEQSAASGVVIGVFIDQ